MFVAFVNACEKIKYHQFSEISWPLISFGIYQWGQTLVMAGFWLFFGIGCVLWWNANQTIHIYLLFHAIRAGVEILMVGTGIYQGLSGVIMAETNKVTEKERVQLYLIGQGMIVVFALAGLTYVPFTK